MIFSVVTAKNKEVLSQTDAVVIECTVTGLTAQLQTVKWQKSDGTDVSNGKTGYTSKVTSYAGGGTQTTSLTVAKTHNNVDSTYKCLITPATKDDATEVSTDVILNVFSK